jgi:hypothetical protein
MDLFKDFTFSMKYLDWYIVSFFSRGHFLVDDNLIDNWLAFFLLFLVVSFEFCALRLFSWNWLAFMLSIEWNFDKFQSACCFVCDGYWINQFSIWMQTSTLIMMGRSHKRGRRSCCLCQRSVIPSLFSFSRHSIPVDANNILYFIPQQKKSSWELKSG